MSDPAHAIPFSDPFEHPQSGVAEGKIHHAYGAVGHGVLDESFALVEPRASLVYFHVLPLAERGALSSYLICLLFFHNDKCSPVRMF